MKRCEKVGLVLLIGFAPLLHPAAQMHEPYKFILVVVMWLLAGCIFLYPISKDD